MIIRDFDIAKGKDVIYEVNVSKDVVADADVTIDTDNNKLTFLMGKKVTIDNEKWISISNGKTIDVHDFKFRTENVCNYVKTEQKHVYENRNFCGFYYNSYILKEDEMVRISSLYDDYEGIENQYFMLGDSSLLNLYLSWYNNDMKIIEFSDAECSFCQFLKENLGIVQWSAGKSSVYNHYAREVYINRAEGMFIINGNAYRNKCISKDINRLFYVLEMKMGHKDIDVSVDKSAIEIGKNSGYVVFKDIELDTDMLNIITQTQGEVYFEVYDFDLGKWVKLDLSNKLKSKNKILRLRAYMHAGDVIKKIIFTR